MEIINLTPHAINIYNEAGHIVTTVEKSGLVARLDSDREKINEVNKIPFFATKYGIPYVARVDAKGKEIERVQFPDRIEGVIHVVSGLFRAGYDRPDIWQPGELIRDDNGQPIGCIGLSR